MIIKPDDTDLLMKYFVEQRRYYDFTIHEVPAMVLLDMAQISDIAQTKELLKGLDDFEQLCMKLEKDERDLIKRCWYYYELWTKYLSNKDRYNSFEACIRSFTWP